MSRSNWKAVRLEGEVHLRPLRPLGNVANGRAYRSVYHRPAVSPPNRVAETPTTRSHAAIPVAIVVLGVGFYLSQYTVVLTALFGVALFFSGLSFLSTRLNPLSPHFYLTRKPSWLAVGVVFLGALFLLWDAYRLFVGGYGPLLNHL